MYIYIYISVQLLCSFLSNPMYICMYYKNKLDNNSNITNLINVYIYSHIYIYKNIHMYAYVYIYIYSYLYRLYLYCPAFMIVEKVVLYICIFGHHGYSTNIHYWSELGTLRTS